MDSSSTATGREGGDPVGRGDGDGGGGVGREGSEGSGRGLGPSTQVSAQPSKQQRPFPGQSEEYECELMIIGVNIGIHRLHTVFHYFLTCVFLSGTPAVGDSSITLSSGS